MICFLLVNIKIIISNIYLYKWENSHIHLLSWEIIAYLGLFIIKYLRYFLPLYSINFFIDLFTSDTHIFIFWITNSSLIPNSCKWTKIDFILLINLKNSELRGTMVRRINLKFSENCCRMRWDQLNALIVLICLNLV